jgi:4-amino-4-deoxy-L-arabinose transferase-like glycosyltransferase
MTYVRLGLPLWEWVVFFLILLLAFLLRFPGLGTNPPGFFRDEVEKGYTAYELAATWRHGVPGAESFKTTPMFPLFIEVYEGHDKTSAIYQYIAAPFVRIGGLSITTTRLPAALCGFLLVAMVWLFARRFLDPYSALVAASVLSFNPTGILFSRWAQQGIVMMLCVLVGVYFLFEVSRTRQRNQRALVCLGAMFLGLGAFAYAPARLVVPMLFVVFFLFGDWKKNLEQKKVYLVGIILFVLIWFPLFIYTLTTGSARLERVGIFQGGLGEGVVLAVQNYIAHFTPDFLFISGDANSRHAMPEYGLLHWGTAILLVMAVGAIGYKIYVQGWKSARVELFLLFALLCAPCAAALTREGIPHALRANLMIPFTALLAGLSVRWDLPKIRKVCLVVVGCVLMVNGGMAFRSIHLLKDSPSIPWEGGVQEALQQALLGKGKVYLSSEIPYANYRVLFAEKVSPIVYHQLEGAVGKTQILPPGQFPPLEEGDFFIAPPKPGIPIEYFDEFVLLYRNDHGKIVAERPGVPSASEEE